MNKENNSNYTAMSVRLDNQTHNLVKQYCKSQNITPSKFLKTLIEAVIYDNSKIHQAGQNILKYQPLIDKFEWILLFDNGEKNTISKNITIDFLDNLESEIRRNKLVRENYIQKNNSNSIIMPHDIINKKVNGEWYKK